MLTISEMFDFTEKTIVVTGGASGIGKEICSFFSGCGANIIIADIFEDKAIALKEELDKNGKKNLAIKVDVTDEKDVDSMISQIMQEFPTLDILFNNAGICRNINAEDMSYHEWKRVIDVNLNAVFLVAQKCGQIMIKQKNGCIINTASMSGHIVNQPQPQSSYNASKAGVILLTKSLAVEWAKYNVRVNSISPGYIGTDMTMSAPKEWTDAWVAQSVTKRLGKPEELLPTLAYLASSYSTFATGSDIIVDGGFTCV